MDALVNVMHGFAVAMQPVNLLYCFIGVFIGTLVGVLPGIGPVSAMSLLLPVTLSGTPEAGIIMMAGIYYGSMYGGSTTSILVNIPGEAASVVTCIDGHEMAKQGRAGPALGMAALASFAAGTFAVLALMLVAPSLARVAPARRLGGIEVGDPARHRARVLPRHPAGGRRRDRVLRQLCDGEEDVAYARALRQGRDRGRGRAGGRQQRGGGRRLHPADDA